MRKDDGIRESLVVYSAGNNCVVIRDLRKQLGIRRQETGKMKNFTYIRHLGYKTKDRTSKGVVDVGLGRGKGRGED